MADGGSERPRRWRVIGGRVLLALGAAIIVMCLALFAGMKLDDSRIEAHLGTATATVLSVSPLRTGIEFIDGGGATVRPIGGVLYPGLLSVGQQFVVEYDTRDPSVVRVAGRTATVGLPEIMMTIGGTAMVTAAGFWLLRRPGRPQPSISEAVTSAASSGIETTIPSRGSDAGRP